MEKLIPKNLSLFEKNPKVSIQGNILYTLEYFIHRHFLINLCF